MCSYPTTDSACWRDESCSVSSRSMFDTVNTNLKTSVRARPAGPENRKDAASLTD